MQRRLLLGQKLGGPPCPLTSYAPVNIQTYYLLTPYRLIYNICRCVVQFVMPMLVVLGVYISIFWRLKNRPITKNSTNFKRRRRTNIMVISVSITFFLSWLPLNALNFLLDVESLNKHSKEVRIKRIFFVKSPNKFVACSWNPEKDASKKT